MNTDNPQTYKQLLARLIYINVFFVILMTFMSFLTFLSYDVSLWHNCPKLDILKVFAQNIRFNLSVAGYFNIPVFIFLLILLSLRPAHIMKASVGLIKSFYLFSFVTVTSLFTLSYLLKNMPDISLLMSKGFFSSISFMYSKFDNPIFIVMLVTMSVIFLITVIFFILFLKFVLTSKEYAVENHNNAIISTLLVLLLCFFFAKGKIIGHLTVRDAAVTPVIQLNEYAVSGPYKILNELKNFNYSNIVFAKNKINSAKSGFVVIEDKSKENRQLYKFTPNK